MKNAARARKTSLVLWQSLCIFVFCFLLVACDVRVNIPTSGISTVGVGISTAAAGTSGGSTAGTTPSGSGCQSNCTSGSGASGLSVFVEPDAGTGPVVDAIQGAKKSVWMEMYLLTNKSVLSALEDAAKKGIDVRVMLEAHPYGGGSVSPAETMDRLKAAGVKAQASDPAFALTHEKGMIIDGTAAYIMTSNMTNAALGASSSTKNREYDIIDKNMSDVQAIMAIFQADWNHSTASFNDSNLVVSPVNSRSAFDALIASARQTLLVTGEEMQDKGIEQDLIAAAHRGVKVQVILPSPSGSNSSGIAIIKQGGVEVREDTRLYMHAKIFVVDGQKGFVGSENISSQSLDKNRELGILISDSTVLNTLQQTFQSDWNNSSKA